MRPHRPRATRGVVGCVAGAALLNLLSRLTGDGWLALASGACLGLPLAALALRPRLGALAVDVAPVRCTVGDPAQVVLTVRNSGRRPSPAVRLELPSGLLEGAIVAVPALAAGGSAGVAVSLPALRRGAADSLPALARATSPLGLVAVQLPVPVRGRVVVRPARRAPLVLPSGAGDGHGASVPVAGSGTEVLGLRPWRPGDAGRAVHARSSARHARPVVLERERESGRSPVVLVTGAGSGPAWEEAVARCAATAVEAVQRGGAPVLLGAGLAAAEGGAGGVLDWFAGVDAAAPLDGTTLDAALRLAAPGGVLLVLAPDAERLARVRAAAAVRGVRVVPGA